jgi:hypothetical protein
MNVEFITSSSSGVIYPHGTTTIEVVTSYSVVQELVQQGIEIHYVTDATIRNVLQVIQPRTLLASHMTMWQSGVQLSANLYERFVRDHGYSSRFASTLLPLSTAVTIRITYTLKLWECLFALCLTDSASSELLHVFTPLFYRFQESMLLTCKPKDKKGKFVSLLNSVSK